MPEYAIRSYPLLCDVTLAAMGRSRINTGNNGVTPFVLYTPYLLSFAFSTLHILHTPHFPTSSFSALLIFYTSQILHSALHVFHRTLFSLQFSSFKSLFRSQIDHTKQRKAFFRTCWKSFSNLRPTGPIARSSACTADGGGEMISCVLDYFR